MAVQRRGHVTGIQRFVYEHTQIFRRFLHDAWIAGLTISGLESEIGMPGIKVVGMICDCEERRPEQKKMQKILDWQAHRGLKEARGFVGIVVYYRIFIQNFSVIAAAIYMDLC
jgi:hypothetical protein